MLSVRLERAHPMARRLAGTAAAVAAVLAMSACGSGASGSSKPTITVYSGQHQQTASALAADFEARTGIHVDLRSGDEGDLTNQLLQEGSSSPADVFFAENPPALAVLDQQSMLSPVTASTLALVPAADNPASGHWVAVSARAVALVYNTDALREKDLPSSVMDLAGSAWKGRLGLAPSETDFRPVVTTVTRQRGTDAATRWLNGLKDNGKVYDSNESLIAAVNRGEVSAGIIDHYYWYRLRDELGASAMHSGLHYFATGDPGALVDISGAAVIASSRHADLAQRFLAYLVGPDGERIIAGSESYEYPLGSGVQTAKPLRPLSELAGPTVDLGDGRQAIALLQQVGLL